MQKLMILLSFSLAAFLVSCNGNAQSDEQTPQVQANLVQVIDFHTTHRCVTCKTIEKKTVEALNEYFKEELDNGTVTFQTVNVDEKDNEAIAEEFEAFGTSLFLNIIKDGKSEKIDLTDFAFTYAMEENDSFEKGFVEEMNKALNKL
jgi:thiol-disulfide isomerase/thioredoxin